MINIIITGHGQFASGMLNAVEQIIGPQSNIEAINFMPEMSTEDLKNAFHKALARFGANSPIMCYSDLLGGSPFRCGVECSMEHSNMRVIAGTNLQMLVETLMEREDVTDIDDYAIMAKDCALHGIILFDSSSETEKVLEVSDDGI